MRTTAIINLKGGTGKTITAINLAAILGREWGDRVLLVDTDSQANLSEFVSMPQPKGVTPAGVADLLRGKNVDPQPTKLENVQILPADDSLMELDVNAASSGVANPMALADYLARPSVRDRVDWCVIDCPPAFSAGAMAALIAADEVVIPMKLDAFGIRGMSNLLEQIRNMRKINPDLEIAGVLPTMYYPTERQKQVETELRQMLARAALRCFPHVRRSPKVDDSTFDQEALIICSPKSAACRDYKLFVRDLITDEEGCDPHGV